MAHVFVYIGEHIADDAMDYDLTAVIGGYEKGPGGQLSEVDVVRMELENGDLLSDLFGDDRPAPGLYMVQCHYWSEQDYWGEWDGGIECDTAPVRWQDGWESQSQIYEVLDTYEAAVRTVVAHGTIGSWRMRHQQSSLFEEIEAWALACRAVADVMEGKI